MNIISTKEKFSGANVYHIKSGDRVIASVERDYIPGSGRWSYRFSGHYEGKFVWWINTTEQAT